MPSTNFDLSSKVALHSLKAFHEEGLSVTSVVGDYTLKSRLHSPGASELKIHAFHICCKYIGGLVSEAHFDLSQKAKKHKLTFV